MYELEYLRYLLHRYVKNEKGVTMIEWIFVFSAVVTVGYILFGQEHKQGTGAKLYDLLRNSFKKNIK